MKKRTIYKILFILLPFLLAFPFHFLYEYIQFPLFSIYFPVNESVFEHVKLTFTPIIITYLIFFFLSKRKLDKQKLLSSLIISIVISTVSMLMLYYIFFEITKKDIMFLSILSLFISIILGQIIGMLTYNKGIKWSIEISIYTLITLTVLLTIFTVSPPNLPFFFDKVKNSYGILVK